MPYIAGYCTILLIKDINAHDFFEKNKKIPKKSMTLKKSKIAKTVRIVKRTVKIS